MDCTGSPFEFMSGSSKSWSDLPWRITRENSRLSPFFCQLENQLIQEGGYQTNALSLIVGVNLSPCRCAPLYRPPYLASGLVAHLGLPCGCAEVTVQPHRNQPGHRGPFSLLASRLFGIVPPSPGTRSAGLPFPPPPARPRAGPLPGGRHRLASSPAAAFER